MVKSKHKLLKVFIYIVAALAVIAIIIGYYIRTTVFKPLELTEIAYIYIEPSTKYDEVAAQIKEEVDLPSDKVFEMIAERMNYPQSIKSGRYAIKDGMTMPEIIRMLRSGNQTAVKLTFNNMRTKENLAGRISNQLMVDSLALLTALKDEKKVEELGFDTNTVVAMFIPNTYEVYWDTSVDKLLTRMQKEYNTFWNESRKAKAKQIGLTPLEVSTLASIVEEEATYSDEYSTVAGLYLNRLKRGQRLEADPTVKFAVGDFSLRRILYKHLEVESPYNTYRNDGLPPGPIRVPSIKGIDATLSPQDHKYLFMVAKDDLSGRHNFSTTHAEHLRNARKYQRALNERRIYK
ncbi:MAG: endolytic transglycosylase MltG [Dysgonamonadaceae bacterium]|nr:endolytic transglycosylase MltG [Dysgonamonadaceae bacterium]